MRAALQTVPGVRNIRVSFGKKLVEVWTEPNKTTTDALIKAIKSLGYKAWDTATEIRKPG